MRSLEDLLEGKIKAVGNCKMSENVGYISYDSTKLSVCHAHIAVQIIGNVLGWIIYASQSINLIWLAILFVD